MAINNIQVAIENDAFDFLWAQCLEKIIHKESVSMDQLYAELFIPDYLIIWFDDNSVKAYRISEIPLKYDF